MATLDITDAQRADLPQAVALLTSLFEQETDFTPDVTKQRQGLEQILNAPLVGSILVAKDNTTVVGMLVVLFTISTAEGGRVAWLEDFVVHADYRSQGVGTRLVEEAIRRLRQQEIRRITLLTDSTNEAAIRFYQRHGFRASAMIPLRLMMTHH